MITFNICNTQSLKIIVCVFLIANSFGSCKKESIPNPGSTLQNRPPVAMAGSDVTLVLPNNSVLLDGSSSYDPDNDHLYYQWTRISLPAPFTNGNPTHPKTLITNLTSGVYLVELKVTDARGLYSTDTVRIIVNYPDPVNGNVLFYFSDPTGSLAAANISVIEGFSPRLVLAKISVENYGEREIEGVFSHTYAPWCPISSIYFDATAFATFDLPPGTHNWSAQNVINNYAGVPIPSGFASYWSTTRTASGTITVAPGSTCIIKEIGFQ